MIKCEDECWKGFNLCCISCEEKETCGEKCTEKPSDCGGSVIVADPTTTSLVPFETKQAALIVDIKNLLTAKAKIEEQEKKLKSRLKDAMEELGIKKFEGNGLVLTYVAATSPTSVDSKKLKEKHPDIFVECSKTSNKAAYVKVMVK